MAFRHLSRRELLERGLALGVVNLAAGLTPAAIAAARDEPAARRRTPETVLGPFYKKGAPETRALTPPGAPGMSLAVSGRGPGAPRGAPAAAAGGGGGGAPPPPAGR